MIIRSLPFLALLALPVLAQERETERPVTKGVATAQDGQALANMFYRAFYLDQGARRGEEAIKLYTKFLTAAPSHRYAGTAATRVVRLMNRSGRVEEANDFRQKYAAAIKKAGDAGRDRPGRGGRGDRGDRARPDPETQAKIAELEKALAKAREDGNEEEVRRIGRQLRNLRGQGGRGRFGGQGGRGRFGGQGGRRGFGGNMFPKLADMEAEEAKEAITRLVDRMDFMLDRMSQRGQAEQAEKIEGKLEKLEKLVEDGKTKEAQKIIDSLQEDMMGAFRRRRGGEGEGQGEGRRRRRGGEEEEGGERRRRRRDGDGVIK